MHLYLSLGIVGVSVLAFAVWRPVLCLMLTLPVFLFLGQLKAFIPVSVSAAAAALPVCALVGSLVRGNRFQLRASDALMVGMGLALAFSVSYSLSPGYGRTKAMLFCATVVPLVVALPSVLRSPGALRQASRVVLFTLIAYVISSLILAGNATGAVGRVAALSSVTVAGQFLGLALLIFVVKSLDTSINPLFRGALLVLAGVAFVLMIRAGTRAPFVALLGTLAFVVWFGREWLQARFRADAVRIMGYILIGILSAIAFYYIATMFVPERIMSRFTSYSALFSNFEVSNDRDRSLNYAIALEGYLSNPLFGVGSGGYRSLILPFIPDYSPAAVEGAPVYPHNILLEFAVELGTMGLVLIGGFIAVVTRSLFNLRPYVATRGGFDIIMYATLFVYGFGVSLTSLDLPRMVILWWGSGLLLAAAAVYARSSVRRPGLGRVRGRVAFA